ncbi:CHRD domain-containing protein [Rhodoferax sp. PAMC 29310]|uniref:CHRD domain-containing protein n=1 Tax=Rhodoferax sp. PAMC 29310 TaxID=2822760 RepID=UPI001B323E77|nr:CHRD domain-containing protein [Rhodoferax sp. PAMC 29310]
MRLLTLKLNGIYSNRRPAMKPLRAIFSLVALLWGATAAQANVLTYNAVLNGANESPASSSTGVGTATVTIDTVALTMEIHLNFSGLSGSTTAAHIHCCTAVADIGTAGAATAVPSLLGFPLGVDAGVGDLTFDMALPSFYNPSFVTAQGGVANAGQAIFAGLSNGTSYLNIHTSRFPGGEIRGFLQQ